MAEAPQLNHIFAEGISRDEVSTRRGAGDPKIRPVDDRLTHGAKLRREVESAADASRTARESADLDELRSLGVIVTVEAAEKAYPLKLDSFESWSRHAAVEDRSLRWMLLVVTTDAEGIERAIVWIADDYLATFFQTV